MREILFRGKRTDTGQWVFGQYFARDDYTVILTKKGTVYKGRNQFYHGISLTAFDVDPSTVGQYTGLTDKNGKKIFEGDIVSRVLYIGMGCGEARGVVVYRAPEFLVDCKHNRVMGFAQYPPENRDYEVIGNATDNPELMEAE